MTNYLAGKEILEGPFFGSAMVVASNGTIIDILPHGKTGILLVDL